MSNEETSSVSSDGWTTIPVGNGEKIDFVEGVPFVGVYKGKSVISDVFNARTGKTEDAPIIMLEDEAGDACFAWASYQLDLALAQVEEGAPVRITFLGTKDTGKGQLNRYRVETK